MANEAEKSEIIHEIGHVVENRMLDSIIEKIMYDASNNEHKVYIIKPNKFISEYQGRIYVTD